MYQWSRGTSRQRLDSSSGFDRLQENLARLGPAAQRLVRRSNRHCPRYDERMGLTTQVLTVRPSRTSTRKARVKFLVDSGAVYSLVPGVTLRKLGLRPYREVTFLLADGTTVTRKVGDAYFEIDGGLGPAPVIFGEEGDEPLLGATTLESLGLILDPFKRRLIPMRMVLACLGKSFRFQKQKAGAEGGI